MSDPYDLQRFVDAQNFVDDTQNPVYEQACSELRQGRKTSHWMWFVFPQLRGLGHSTMSHTYGISSPAEAEAYLRHPVLGSRLRECTRLLNQVEGRSIEEIFGYTDHLKFRSCMTLFASATDDNEVFLQALKKCG